MDLDPHIVRKAQRGDREAQELVLRRFAGPLHALVRRTSPRASPDDLTQALLEKLLLVLPRFEEGGAASFSTWVFTIAHRFLLDHLKRKTLSLAPLEDGLEVAAPAPGADRQVETRELGAAFDRAVARLPEAQRLAFVLVHVHGHPLEQAAALERVPVGTIKSRLHRARAAMALELGELLDVPVVRGVAHGER